MKFKKSPRQTTLIVDNLSPFTPDIVSCLNKLGASFIQRSFSSLNNVTINSNEDNNSSKYNYKYYGHNRGDNAYINNKSKGLGDGANYDKKNNIDGRDIIDTNNNTNNTNNIYNTNNIN